MNNRSYVYYMRVASYMSIYLFNIYKKAYKWYYINIYIKGEIMKKLKNLNLALVIIMLIIDLYYIINGLIKNDTSRLINQLSLFLVLLIPLILEKLFSIKFSRSFKLLYNFFIFLALVLGIIINLYHTTHFYDKLVHGLSGTASALLALLTLNYYENDIRKNVFFNFIFMMSLTLLIAALWEYFEFFVDIFLKSDTQHVANTGVNDTMYDMLFATVGAIVFGIVYVFKHSSNSFIALIDSFRIKKVNR